jgi:[citrate (pro-3S)-lyase] ligase
MRDIIKLGFTEDFSEYIDLLGKANREEKLTILVASHDTPCGSSNFTEDVAKKLCRALGTKTLLHDKYRYSFAAIIDKGVVKYECASPNKAIDYECKIRGKDYRVSSANFNLKALLGEKEYVKFPRVSVEHHNFVRKTGRGLYFTVINSLTGDYYDTVSFDTYNPDIPPRRFDVKNDMCLQTGIKEWKSSFPGVTFMSIAFPTMPEIGLSKHEEYILRYGISMGDFMRDPGNKHNILLEYLPDEEAVLEVLTPPKSYTATDGARKDFDTKGRFVNTENGHRITVGNPETPKRTIYFIGFCYFFGFTARDDHSIESILQAMLNENVPDDCFTVQNYGYYLWSMSAARKRYELLKILDTIFPKPGDIVFIEQYLTAEIIVDCSRDGFRPHNHGEIFFEAWHQPYVLRQSHLTENGYKLVAQRVFETLSAHDFFRDYDKNAAKPEIISKRDHKPLNFTPEERVLLDNYKKTLSDFYDSLIPQYGENYRMGAIVMNCNPFTLGHRYLIETAAAKVDFLLVFVVSEDKSIFRFEDRFRLVDLGTSDLPNVGVIESGKFIISTTTFTTYFNKEELQGVVVDSSLDVTVFAQEIAPAAHIQVRFVGTEPFDTVTLQYNRTLEYILPAYGIDFEEIPRKEVDGSAVSASKVRKLLIERNFGEIEKLVPKSTLEFLSLL